MTVQDTLLALTVLYLATGIAVLADLDITPASIRRHYQTVALTDRETADLLRKHPLLCNASHVFVYLIELGVWPLLAWAVVRRRAKDGL